MRALFGALVVIALGATVLAQDIRITVLSSRPDMVSGDDALVEVVLPPSTSAGDMRITVNGHDVSGVFHPGPSGHSQVGLVGGLQRGKNVLRVDAGGATEQRELTNYPITGPILSGPHMTPFVCTTVEAGLGPALDENCSAATRIEYFYRTKAGDFKPLLDPTVVPSAELAQTTISAGRTVPYIVRVESGTINRSIYRIAILDDPLRASTQPWSPGPGWNGRLAVTFGGGCGSNYNQGVNTVATVLTDLMLSRGFAHMVSTQNVLGQHCNDHLSAEALMMIKEHFIERYGVPVWTVGFGQSGGAMQQLLIAQNFPGLLDGILPSLTVPDALTAWSAGVSDCRLLLQYFGADPVHWTKEKRQAVEGFTPGTCEAWNHIIAVAATHSIVATKGCGISQELVYDPVRNPKGARCTFWDTNVNTYGRDPATGRARRTFDNVGVQYGLQALNSGTITKAEFLDLNSRIGGYDQDGNVRPERTVADAEAVRLAYAAGRVNSGTGGLGSVPILQYRSYTDPMGDVHDRVRDLAVRERLLRVNGRADNQVLWVHPGSPTGPLNGMIAALALDTMSQWLDRLVRDTSSDPAIVKVVRAKPVRAVDACWDSDLTRFDEPSVFNGSGKCNALFPWHANPRLAAGGPLTDDILKCQLKPLNRSDYFVSFGDAEWRQLTHLFPSGVCDNPKPGVNQGGIAGTYLSLPLSHAARPPH